MRARLKIHGERLLPTAVRERREAERQEAEAKLREAEDAAAARQREAEAEAAAQKRAEQIAKRRRAMLESDSALREFTVDGTAYYGRVVDTFTASAASAHNLGLVVSALEAAGIDYFVVPGLSHSQHVLGVRFDDRKRFLVSLRELYGGSPLYIAKPSPEGLPAEGTLYADGSLPTEIKRSHTVRLGEILLGPAGQVLADLEFGCDVEFWRDGEKLLDLAPEKATERIKLLLRQNPAEVMTDALVAPRRNAVAEVLPAPARTPATLTVRERTLPSFPDFLAPRVDTVDFPVDVVYTWVDGNDAELTAKRDSYRTGLAPTASARETGASRYVSRDELKYSLRSLQMYGEFIRHVYIVTDGQTPSWLDPDAAGITVVDHKEIFADPSALPVFNSHAIGSQLHRIPGLSEHYLYFNDDVFLGRPVTAEHFFHGNGIARLPFSPSQFGTGDPHPDEPAPSSAGKNVRRLILDSHSRFITNKFMHTPHPQVRSVMQEIEERYADEVDRTSRSRFRAPTDIAMASSLHHHYAYLTGRAVPGTYHFRYVHLGKDDMEQRLAELLRTRRFDFFCLNDVDLPAEDRQRVDEQAQEFMESYFPYPSSFERSA
ncbi:stealth family protein [Streptomyces apocyni]|uniref:stealth family protein n=1 Tax=Streptomyces apocyni TaxID=2654677 RepID=UPI0012EAE47F|nr:stealth family protein [Streptomyces apocyni]